MDAWWDDEVVGAGKLPLVICLLAFVLTFVTTRVITRMIRAGRGPFRDNVSASGTHVHHAVPGIILLVLGALMALGLNTSQSPWIEIAAVLVGAGASLVLDEFALILHLHDVYWENEGRVSVEMIGLTGACLGLFLLGYSPLGVTDIDADAFGLRIVLAVGIVLHGFFVLVCVFKGKYRAALIGCFVPFVAWWCAIRLARPTSWWARHLYWRQAPGQSSGPSQEVRRQVGSQVALALRRDSRIPDPAGSARRHAAVRSGDRAPGPGREPARRRAA